LAASLIDRRRPYATERDSLLDEEGLRAVYVHYAFAAHLAQQVEGNLQTLLMAAIKAEKGLSYEGYKALESVWSRKTLGELLRCARECFGASPGLDPLLKEARTSRNYLIHHFFNANAEKFLDNRRYPELLVELKSISDLMEEARFQIYSVMEGAVLASGTTREEWERELAVANGLFEEAVPEGPPISDEASSAGTRSRPSKSSPPR
jgi:hypothetical protein